MKKKVKNIVIISVTIAILLILSLYGLFALSGKKDIQDRDSASMTEKTGTESEGAGDAVVSKAEETETERKEETENNDASVINTSGAIEGKSEYGVTDGSDEAEENRAEVDPIDELPYYPFRVFNDQVIVGRSGWLFYGSNESIASFDGSNLMSESELSKCVKALEDLDKTGSNAGKEIRIMICPEKEAVYPEYYPTVEKVSDDTRADILYEHMINDTDVCYIYPKQALKEEKRNVQLYYTYDSHWNSAGGYVGARELLSALDIHMDDIKNLDIRRSVPISGDLVILGNLNAGDCSRDVDYEIKYRPDIEILSAPESLAGEHIAEYVSDSDNDLIFVMVGDSFNVQMMKYICKEYSHCFFVHRSSIAVNEAKKIISDADILVLEAVERNLGLLADDADRVRKCLEN